MAADTVRPVPLVGRSDDEDDDKFLDFSRELARAFVYFHTVSDAGITARGGGDEKEAEEPQPDPKTTAVVKKLQKWGDDLNEVIVDRVEQEHQALVNEQSVWELGYSKVEAAVATILTSCQGYFRSGWEQVAVVYMTVSRLIPELRVAQRDPVRERQMQDYAGRFFIRNPSLREVIRAHEENIGDGEIPVVKFDP